MYIAERSNPWTIQGKQTCLAIPDQDWERIGYKVIEGAAIVVDWIWLQRLKGYKHRQ